jgi:CelD/BcsL family acetyltransferase involved in cellulose biosynthesis
MVFVDRTSRFLPGPLRIGPHGGVTVDRISDPAQLPALAQVWDEMIDETSPGAVFRSSAWLLPWWRHLSEGKELATYVAREGGRVIGVLPAYSVRSAWGGRQLRLLGDGTVTSDCLGVIARPEDLERAVQAVAQAVLGEQRDLFFDGVLADDPLVDALRRPSRGFFARSEVCPYISISPSTDFGAWMQDRPRGLAAQLRRRRGWLEKRSGFKLEVLTDATDVARALPTLWQLHRARWATEGGTKALPSPSVEDFHAEAAVALARRGWVRLYLLHADGAIRAALYAFERGRRLQYYQMGTDPEWRNRSLGTVILGAAQEDAFERGLAEFDLLRGPEPYKLLYTSSSRSILAFRVAAGVRRHAVRLGDRVLEPSIVAARRRLPDPVRQRLTRSSTIRRLTGRR